MVNTGRGKRRTLSTATATAAVVVALTAARSTRLSATAFVTVNTPASFSYAKKIPTSPSLIVFAQSEDAKKLEMEIITDANRETLLGVDRPVLVDAFAPWCGPCKLLDKVLRAAQPFYVGKVDFVRWNVNDKENTVELKNIFLDSGHTLTKLPSLIVFREGKPVAVRAGLANEFQLDFFLENTLPDVLESTFDENGVKLVPMPEGMSVMEKEEKKLEERTKPKEVEKEKEVLLAAMKEVMANSSKSTLDKASEGGRKVAEQDCFDDPASCIQSLEDIVMESRVWQNRTVIPAMEGILPKTRHYASARP